MFKRAKLASLWSRLVNNYWFVPAAVVAAAVGFSFALPAIDNVIGDARKVVPGLIYQGGPEGARVLLSTIAASMISVAALTFSITIVALTTASQQFGPRLLRNFIRDRGYQVVLGTFLAAFVYCLLVLRAVRSNGAEEFVPYISLAFGIVLAVAGVGVLVYFIHHAAFSIRAETVVAATGRELRAAIDRIFPENPEGTSDRSMTGRLPEGFPQGIQQVTAQRSGYIQAIDRDHLVKIACDKGLIIRLEHREGYFVVEEGRLLEVWPEMQVDEELKTELNECFVFGTQRSLNEDVESAVDQLVEVAVRALSPSLNDPETAVSAIDQLTDALGRVGERTIPPAFVSHEGEVRLVTYPLTYTRLVEAAFSRVRQYSRGCVPVALRLLESIASLCTRVQYDSHRKALMRQAQMIWNASRQAVPDPEDLAVIETRFRAAERAAQGHDEQP